MAEGEARPKPDLKFEQTSLRINLVPQGCSFGIGVGNGARNDARSVFTVWFLSCWSIGILLLAILSWILRRAVLEASARVSDRRQARALDRFRKQFHGCRLREAELDEVLPRQLYQFVSAVGDSLKRPGKPRIWYVAEVMPGAVQPSAFTTFFFLKVPPIIICPSEPLGMSDYQRFILYHELGHASGFQTSHSLGRMVAVADGFTLAIWFTAFGSDHDWGLSVLGVYALLRLFELSASPSSASAEAHADLWGLFGVEADGIADQKLDRVIQLHRRFLASNDPVRGQERLTFVQDWRERQLHMQAEQIDEWTERVGPGGVVPYVVEKNVMDDFSESLSIAENHQAVGPEGLGRWRFSAMLLTAVAGVVAIGISLPAIDIFTLNFGLCAAAMIFVASSAKAIAMEPLRLAAY